MLNINQEGNILIIILFFIYNIILINCESCFDYNDCFNCTMCGDESNTYCNCAWQTNGFSNYCIEDEFRSLSEWYKELLKCSNNEEQELYCSGKDIIYSKDDLNSDTLTFQIRPDSRGNYGKKMLFCFYNYIDESSNDYKLNIQFSDSSTNKPKVAYGCSSNEKWIDKAQKIEESKELTCSGGYNIFFLALLKTQYKSSPITFQLTLKKSSLNKYVAAFSVAIIFILLITCIICCTTRYYNNKARRQIRILMNERARANMIRIEEENNNMDIDNAENLEEINKEKLDQLFATKMAEHLYKSEYNQYGGGCSICLENFKKKSKVSMTPCNHVFHFNCIKDWLYKNAKNPKCPNCNKEVLANDESNIDGKLDEAKIIKVKKKAQNNNNLNNNLNFAGRPNLNNNTATTFNRGRGDISQSSRQHIGNY